MFRLGPLPCVPVSFGFFSCAQVKEPYSKTDGRRNPVNDEKIEPGAEGATGDEAIAVNCVLFVRNQREKKRLDQVTRLALIL